MGKKYALVIGVRGYDKVPPLKFGAKDAQNVAEALMGAGFESDKVIVLHDDKPGSSPERARVLHHLGRLKQISLEADDLVIFYFSGHGMMQDNNDYLLPIEASDAALEDTALSVELVVKRLQETGSRNVVMLLDACRDELPTGKSVLSIGANAKSVIDNAEEGVAAIFSCQSRERSFEIEELEQSSFTHCLLKAIADPAISTVGETASFLANEVKVLNGRYGKRPQVPYLLAQPESLINLAIFGRISELIKYSEYLLELYTNSLLDKSVFYDVMTFLDQTNRDIGRMMLVKDVFEGSATPEQFERIWKMIKRPSQRKKKSEPIGDPGTFMVRDKTAHG